MTYGWAILIIVIVAAVLYSLGIFNPTSFVATESVSGFAGLGSVQAQCQAGGLAMSIGDSIGSEINVTSISMTVDGDTYSTVFPSYKGYPADYLILPDQAHNFILTNACPNGTGHFSATVTVSYTEVGQVFPGPYQSTGTISGSSVTQWPLYTSSLVGYWPLDEGSGMTAHDLSGNGNTGTLVNSPKWLSGSSCRFSGCLNLSSASSQYITASATGLPSGTSAFTLTAWVKQPALNTNAILSFGTGVTNEGALIYITATGYLDGQFYGSGASGVNQSVSTGTWHFISMTYSGSGQSVMLYLDGSGASYSIGQTPSIVLGSVYLCANTVPSSACTATVEDARIYNTALSASAVAALYQSSVPNFEQ